MLCIDSAAVTEVLAYSFLLVRRDQRQRKDVDVFQCVVSARTSNIVFRRMQILKVLE